jgi:hypothetical protein
MDFSLLFTVTDTKPVKTRVTETKLDKTTVTDTKPEDKTINRLVESTIVDAGKMGIVAGIHMSHTSNYFLSFHNNILNYATSIFFI